MLVGQDLHSQHLSMTSWLSASDSGCSSCRTKLRPLVTKAWSEFLWGTKGALNHWASAWENCKLLIDSPFSNLFSSTGLPVWLGSRDESGYQPRTASSTSKSGLGRQEWCKSIKGAKIELKVDDSKSKGKTCHGDAFWPTNFRDSTDDSGCT